MPLHCELLHKDPGARLARHSAAGAQDLLGREAGRARGALDGASGEAHLREFRARLDTLTAAMEASEQVRPGPGARERQRTVWGVQRKRPFNVHAAGAPVLPRLRLTGAALREWTPSE
jgi:hypothetical protein